MRTVCDENLVLLMNVFSSHVSDEKHDVFPDPNKVLFVPKRRWLQRCHNKNGTGGV